MKGLSNIIIVVIFLLAIYFIVKKVIIPIAKDIKNYKKMSEQEQDKLKILLLIFLAPVILLFLDYYNIFSKLFPQYENLSREYDWLSFIGTYVGTIVSSILLIFITEKDRNENTAVIRTSQRPYLDISYMKIDSKFFEENKDNVITFNHGKNSDKTLEKDEYLTLCIKNNGASVAIIDTNKTKIKLQYKIKNEIKEDEFNLKFSINRLSIKSGEAIYVNFVRDELYKNKKLLGESKLLSSTIFYKDLFNKNYCDQCELKGTLLVLHDNEEIYYY